MQAEEQPGLRRTRTAFNASLALPDDLRENVLTVLTLAVPRLHPGSHVRVVRDERTRSLTGLALRPRPGAFGNLDRSDPSARLPRALSCKGVTRRTDEVLLETVGHYWHGRWAPVAPDGRKAAAQR